MALEEVQDVSGATDDGTVAADVTINKLIAAISAARGPSYSYREIDPVNDADGGEPGGNIRVVFLFNAARVSFVDVGDPAVNRSTTGTTVSNVGGVPTLSLSPGRIDPTNPIWSASRKPLVGEFTFNGKSVFVIAITSMRSLVTRTPTAASSTRRVRRRCSGRARPPRSTPSSRPSSR